MIAGGELTAETAEELFEDAPCGYITTRTDGTIVRVNRTFEGLTGHLRQDLVGTRRFQDLLSPGGRIYYDTHYAPLLEMQGTVREIAVEIVRADGSRLPALVTSVLNRQAPGRPALVRTTVFDATERRRYEQELLGARERERKIAADLQRSMLSGALPSAERLSVGVAYQSAVTGLEAGGDWYDAFWLEEPLTAGLVVGDVVGHGLEAAATMGQLRSAVRALAATGLRPARLLDALDGYVERHGVGSLTTMVYAELSLADGVLRYACAGHLPPLALSPEGGPGYLWGGRSLPLDAQPSGRSRDEAETVLEPGSLLLLYTDGLVERRGGALEAAMQRLQGLAQALRADPPTIAREVVRQMRDPTTDDDVCVLAARLEG